MGPSSIAMRYKNLKGRMKTMKDRSTTSARHAGFRRRTIALALTSALGISGAVHAFEIDTGVEDLTVRFHRRGIDVAAVNGVSFALARGETLTIPAQSDQSAMPACCRCRSRWTTPARWPGRWRTARCCCRRWPATIRPIPRARLATLFPESCFARPLRVSYRRRRTIACVNLYRSAAGNSLYRLIGESG